MVLSHGNLRRDGERIKTGYQYAILNGYDIIIDLRDHCGEAAFSLLDNMARPLVSGECDAVYCMPAGEGSLATIFRRIMMADVSLKGKTPSLAHVCHLLERFLRSSLLARMPTRLLKRTWKNTISGQRKTTRI